MSDDEPHDTPSLRTPHPSEELQRLLARALRAPDAPCGVPSCLIRKAWERTRFLRSDRTIESARPDLDRSASRPGGPVRICVEVL